MNNPSENINNENNNNLKDNRIILIKKYNENSSNKKLKNKDEVNFSQNFEKSDEEENDKQIENINHFFELSNIESYNNDEIKEKKQFLCNKRNHDNYFPQVISAKINHEYNEKINQFKELDIHEINENDSISILNYCNLSNKNTTSHLPNFGENHQLMANEVDNKKLITKNCKVILFEYNVNNKKRINNNKKYKIKNNPFNKRNKNLKDFLKISIQKLIGECKEESL